MRCRKCRGKAVINMRQHRLALCKSHYLDWIVNQTERFINKYKMFSHDDRILVAVSGGKDSLALWDVIHRLGYQVDGLYLDLGIDQGEAYSQNSLHFCEKFAHERDLNLQILNIQDTYGETIPGIITTLHRIQSKPCSVCGLTKRHEMNRIAWEHGYTVLATGHNLDDEAAVLFSNTLNWSKGHLVRQGPVLEASENGLARKVKPFCRFYERETAAYALLRGIEYIENECPFSHGANMIANKELLNQLETQRPGAKLSFYLSFLRAKDENFFNWTHKQVLKTLSTCPNCGQPTSSAELCTFCRTIQQVEDAKKPAGV